MDKFEIYVGKKGYLVYKNNIHLILKFIYSEKAKKFGEISNSLLTGTS